MRKIFMTTVALALLSVVAAPALAQQGDYRGGNDARAASERRNDNNANVALAGAAGLAVGAALASNGGAVRLYAPGYAYPVYGQAGYGDPRSDPRYAQGGYAYGRSNGRWVSISDRVQWLDQRIDRGARDGSLDRRQARSLRRELTGLEQTENGYRRGGLQAWEMADLDQRFDRLASRIQYERTDGDRASGRYPNR